MKDLGLSAKTIRVLHAMPRQCLDQAVQERLIPHDPAARCRLPPKEKKEMQKDAAQGMGSFVAQAV